MKFATESSAVVSAERNDARGKELERTGTEGPAPAPGPTDAGGVGRADDAGGADGVGVLGERVEVALPPFIVGPIRRLTTVLARCTEAPPIFIAAAATTVIGLLLGRKVSVSLGRDLYPNFQFVIVGKTGRVRKTTAIDLVLKHVARPLCGNQLPFKLVRGRVTGEGLLDAVKDVYDLDEKGRPGKMLEWGNSALWVPDEFAGQLKKEKQNRGGQLSYVLIDIADATSPLTLQTRHSPITATEAIVSTIGSTTSEALLHEMDPLDTESGFFNRLLFVEGEAGGPLPFPPPPDPVELQNLISELWGTVALVHSNPCRITLSAAGKAYWEEWYLLDFYRERSGATARTMPHAMRLAMFNAVMERSSVIEPHHLQAAIAFSEHCAATATRLFSTLHADQAKRSEDRVVKAISDLTVERAGAPKRREVHARTGFSAERFRKAVDALANVGVIEVTSDARLRVLTEDKP